MPRPVAVPPAPPARLRVCAVLCAVAIRSSLGASSSAAPPHTAVQEPAATRPATAPRVLVPGIEIDWAAAEVRAAGDVVFRDGPLEFVACFRGKEHESLVRLRAPGTQLFMALGLIGMSPGRPPRWNEDAGRFDPAEGDPVDIEIEWASDGQVHRADANRWIRNIADGLPPVARPWVLAGSIRRPDGRLACDGSGGTVALVDFPDNLIGMSRAHSNRNDELWAEANSPVIPPLGTPVWLIFRAARPLRWKVELDELALIRVDGRIVESADLADLIASSARIEPGRAVEIELRGTLLADELRLGRELRQAGVKDGWYRLRRSPAEPGTSPRGAP